MLICPKCGIDNPFGRVFCGGCGHKLDMSNVGGAKPMGQGWDRRRFAKIVNAGLASTLTLTVLVIVLICWPTGAEPTPGVTATAAAKVEAKLAAVESLKLGQKLEISAGETDINSYLRYGRSRELKIMGMVVSLEQGYALVHVERKSTALKLGKLQATLSYDLACVSSGNRLIVRKASVGHLPLWGPFKGSAITTMRRLFVHGREHAILKDVTEIKIDKGVLTVTVEK